MKSVAFICLLLLLVGPSFQYGILRVEEIFSVEVDDPVTIEEIVINDSDIEVDFIYDLTGEGVLVEEVLFSDGSITLPKYFTHCCGINFISALYANGGIYADAGRDSGEFSFIVEDNTGNVFFAGELFAQGGVNVNDQFVIEAGTGDTTIDARILPNGGINVNDLFTVSNTTADIFTAGNAQFAENIFFGVPTTSNRTIARLTTQETNGGSTYFEGQSARSLGGNLFLVPGEGITKGKIILGNSNARTLYFGRSASIDGTNGGFTTIAGQSSLNGNGGDLIFNAGNTEAIGSGGDIVLAPGVSQGTGLPGKLIVGSPNSPEISHDLILGRPPLPRGESGDTYWAGQSTLRGNGGNTYFKAGSVFSGNGAPGDVLLSPGDSRNTDPGVIYVGRPLASELIVSRIPVVADGGFTVFAGQTGLAGSGGDLYLDAGDAGRVFDEGNDQCLLCGTGGDVYLVPGSSLAGVPGFILLGLATSAVEFRRGVFFGTGHSTIIAGQQSVAAVGGDLNLFAGNGDNNAGSVFFGVGTGATISLQAGVGNTFGGEIQLKAGSGYLGRGGDVLIVSGNTESLGTEIDDPDFEGGDITISAGAGVLGNGLISFGNAQRVIVQDVPVIFANSLLNFFAGDDVVTLDPTNVDSILRFNGRTLLRASLPVFPVSNTQVTFDNLRSTILNLSYNMNSMVNALSQCGHGLIYAYNQAADAPIDCDNTMFTSDFYPASNMSDLFDFFE